VTAEPSSSASWKTVIVYSIAVAMVGSATLTPESERKKKKEKTPPFELVKFFFRKKLSRVCLDK